MSAEWIGGAWKKHDANEWNPGHDAQRGCWQRELHVIDAKRGLQIDRTGYVKPYNARPGSTPGHSVFASYSFGYPFWRQSLAK